MPWNARAIAIQQAFHEQAAVRSRAADMPFPTGGYPLSALVGRRGRHVTASTSLPKADEQRGRGTEITTFMRHTKGLADDRL